MSETKRKVPKLRFPGFTEDWEQRKSEDIFISITDKGHSGLPVLSASQEWGMIRRDEGGIDIQHDKANENTYKRVLPGQFVIHLRSFQGGFAYSEIEGITSPAYTVIDFKNQSEHYPLFWKHVFKSSVFIKRLETITYGIRDGRSISFSDFKTLSFRYPTLDEQKNIADSIEVFEKYITLHQSKLENLKLKKKALLQKLFPKNGEQFPELRFPGFTDAWEQRKLGEVVKSYSGGTPTASNKEYYGGDIPFIRSAEINSDMTELYITQKGLDNSSAKMVEKGTILYAMYGATSGEVGISKINGAINQAILAMIPSGYNSKIIAQYLRKNKESIIGKYLQGGQGNLSANIILDLSIELPGIEESNQIANFLESFDNIITLHQRKLEHLQLQKKALLQQMFV